MSNQPVRVRFAPSPTGPLHIGGVRTALFNWLFARRHGGKFILRIEDTDQKRSVPGSEALIMNGLRYVGVDWDEGPDIGGAFAPYVQSERVAMYQQWANWLLEQGKAYKCYATPEELARAREIAQKSKGGKVAGYERIYRFISDAERARIEAERPNYVIRLAMPIEGETVVQDAIHGTVRFPNEELSDIVLLKSDGFPTYHLAMAVDDHFMEISHVLRADEWLPSLPMHQTIYAHLGWALPTFAHLPIMTHNGKKISKRNPPVNERGEVIPVLMHEYVEKGYQPEALFNWLVGIGWTFGDDIEIFSRAEAIARFSLDKISNSPTDVPFSKLDHLNGHYIRALAPSDFLGAVRPLLETAYGQLDETKLGIIAPVLQERVNPLNQAVELTAFLWLAEVGTPSLEDLIPKKMDAAATKAMLQRSYDTLAGLPDFAATTQENALRALVEELGLKPGQLFNAVRWATTNQRVSPPLFDSLAALGKETTLQRLQVAINLL